MTTSLIEKIRAQKRGEEVPEKPPAEEILPLSLPLSTATLPKGEIIPSSQMYSDIAHTLRAMSEVSIDGKCGNGPISPQLSGRNTKRYIPDTEIDMLKTGAIPLSASDVADFDACTHRIGTLKYKKGLLGLTTRTLDEITGPRMRIAYRLARYMTHIRGIGAVGQPLNFSMASKNAQVNLLEFPLPYDPVAGWYRGLSSVRNLLAETMETDRQFSYSVSGEVYRTKGMSILPPPIHDGYYPPSEHPENYRRVSFVPDNYDPLFDGPLNTYLNMMELIVRHLNIGQNGDAEEDAAVYALLNPAIARLSWPCSDEIQTFEEGILLPFVNKRVVDLSRVAAIDSLKKPMISSGLANEEDLPGLGLTHTEAFDLVETAITYAELAYTFDPKRERSTMLNKIHGLADKCDRAGMVTTELNSFKTISQILGLTRQDEDSNMDKRDILSSALEAEIIEKKSLKAKEDN
jgi:hypothetical protein